MPPKQNVRGGTKKSTSSPTQSIEEPSQPAARKSQSILWQPSLRRGAQYIVLTAMCSPISQLTLSPVYGTHAAGLYHKWTLLALTISTFMAHDILAKVLPHRVLLLLSPYALWIPTIQYYLFHQSSRWGATYGPIITEALTYYPLIVLSIYAASVQLSKLDLSSYNQVIRENGPALGSYLLLNVVQLFTRSFITRNIGRNFLVSRIGWQMILGFLYAVSFSGGGGGYWWVGLPSVAMTIAKNVHNPMQRTTMALNDTLHTMNYSLVARQESVSGYVSVLDNLDANMPFRVMRCDHSILGGEWKIPSKKAQKVKEPIFAIFTMLEAVRLIERDTRTGDALRGERALSVGLGVGTAPAAMIAHGINTTILELDPTVYKFALEHFDFPKKHNAAIGDAVQIVGNTAKAGIKDMYDYVIHDVFTGGSVPVQLFSTDFLEDLQTLMKPDGVIAIVSFHKVLVL